MSKLAFALLPFLPLQDSSPYRRVVAKTAAMVSDASVQALAGKHGLRVLNVTWEDTGRYKNSAVGPNISDMTIQVQQRDPGSAKAFLTCMPVIRPPNFTDKTADLPIDRFFVLVGNQKGGALRRVTLASLLGDLRKFLSKPDSWKGSRKSLLAERDTHVLVSAQACFLPIPKGRSAEFNPVLFNYQSYAGDPAVLTILATRQGSSVTVIDNKRDAFQAGQTWGQRLFFNKNGERCVLTGKRLSDHVTPSPTKPRGQPGGRHAAQAAGQGGLGMVLLVQVPLKQKKPRDTLAALGVEEEETLPGDPATPSAKSNVESAVIGHGKVQGPFTEIADLDIERDKRFPIRVTVQFYKATSNGVVSAKDMRDIAAQINRVYEQADYVGSLVTDGATGRPTEYDGPKIEPPDWWETFWARHRANTGQTPQEAMRMLRALFGPNWKKRPQKELGAALAKKR